jgi:hypothetical protein
MLIRNCIVCSIITGGLVSAQTCASQQSVVTNLKQAIEQDKKAIKRLGFNTDAAEFDALVSASTEQRNQMVHARFKNLLDGLTGAALETIGASAGAALAPQAGLPNGYASLNPFNVNTYIKGLDNPTGPVASLLRQVASTSDKAAKLNFLKGLPNAVGQEEASYELLFGEASTQPRSLSAYLKLTTELAQLGGYPEVAAVLEIGTSGADVLVAYSSLLYGNLVALNQLNQMSVANANALVNYDSTLKAHVQALRAAKSQFDACRRGEEPYSVGYSRGGSFMTIAVGFESAAPRNSVEAWLSGPGGLIRGMAICSQRSPVNRNGRQVSGLFYVGCFDSTVGPGHWLVNVCPTSQFSDARYQCSSESVDGKLVYFRCGCGLKREGDEAYPKYEPEFSIPVDLAPGQSVSIKIKSQ